MKFTPVVLLLFPQLSSVMTAQVFPIWDLLANIQKYTTETGVMYETVLEDGKYIF